MSATGMGTVTYNDGKRMLAFGHPFFNLGPVDMPMAKSEILMVFSSSAISPPKSATQPKWSGALQPGPPYRHHGRAGRGSAA